MYLADYHVHSHVSPDGKASMLEMAAAAEAEGLDEICFTDHLETVIWRENKRPADFDWSVPEREYRETLENWHGRTRLRLGLEVGGVPFNVPHAEALMAQEPQLDFVIGSIHMLTEAITDLDLAHFHPADEAEALRSMADYLELVRQTAVWGRFSVLGHLTLSLRYLNELQGFQLSFDPFGAEIEEILRTVIQKGRGIELNTNRGNMPLPGAKWLRLYRSLGGEIITLGSDAHRPGDVGRSIREGQRLLRECGFKRFCTFEKMEPIWHEL
ncbi:histidinol-phosphatase HisJ family protein [Dysosmobacter sp.]|uniref:histidinol-phosphatase HisJ family protein n=1 Tax=Dysosmobacter sp. TaxID=2591382 RepID=UPI002A8D45C3|nr:histidinol-phosphatase HisJ family protein [Dysosmobacter sp.]MDY3985238.1 histidinol-phosphatase HisJ family protein [Dysosmobacter sp.]